MPLSHEDVAKLRCIGRNIHLERKRCGMTQQQLADAVNVQVRTVNKFERGKINIPTVTLLRIRNALRCGWDALLDK
jgi:transcriptional regulator with XRE-family HTH domain